MAVNMSLHGNPFGPRVQDMGALQTFQWLVYIILYYIILYYIILLYYILYCITGPRSPRTIQTLPWRCAGVRATP